MFFVVSKLIWFVTAPVNALLFGLALAGILHVVRRRRAAIVLATLCGASLLAIGFLPIGALVLRPLEDRFPQPPTTMAAPTGIIVLGGSTDEVISDARHQVTVVQAATRITAGVELARRYPQARLAFTGGSGALVLRVRSEAEDTRQLWIDLGVPADRITVEDRSRNTDENVRFVKALLDPKPGERWLLVTSAAHMPRAVALFRANEFPVLPYPVDYATSGTWADWLVGREAIANFRRFDIAVREWVGLVVYRLTGRTKVIFPAPDPVHEAA